MSEAKHRILVIVFDGIEEVEALAPVDIFRRAGIETTMASLNGEKYIHGRNDITFAVDLPISEIDASTFDAVFLPGGPGVFELVENTEIHSLLKQFASSDRLTTAICAAPKVLAAAGLLDSRNATSHASVRGDLPLPSDLPVVIDGNIITSQGAGTAIQFALAVTAKLISQSVADKIADSIHAPSR